MYICDFGIDLSITHACTSPISWYSTISQKVTKSPLIRVPPTQKFYILPIKALLPTTFT